MNTETVPAVLLAATARMRTLPGAPLGGWEANEANALSYTASEGHHLSAHCDDRQLSGDTLVNLSLGGDATMEYTHDRDRGRSVRVRLLRVLLPRSTETSSELVWGLHRRAGTVRQVPSSIKACGRRVCRSLGVMRIAWIPPRDAWECPVLPVLR